MTKLLYLFLFCVVPMDALEFSYRQRVARTCARPDIVHGTARLKQRGRMARYECDAGYDLVGDKYATCLGGKWDMPKPVCVRNGCQIPKVEHAIILPTHRNAWLNIFCLPGYSGSATLFCDGRKWNGTIPTCVTGPNDVDLSCDFESPSLCGWTQDSRHDFDWTRINKKTPSAFLFTGPAFDHTLGEGKQGYYMYIESSSKSENDTARLISPVFAGGLEKNGCFSFFYHMYGRSIGGLRVYQLPESQKDQVLDENDKDQYLLFEKWGNQGDEWFRNVSYLKDVSDNFQIVIEGIRGTSFTSDIAIDDVAILSGPQCEEAIATAVTPADDIPDSCSGRCSETVKPHRGCGCSTSCISDSDCCADFLDVCVFNPDFANRDDDDITTAKTFSDAPRTEKLIAPTSTTSTTATIPVSTTITPNPTTLKSTTTTKAATIAIPTTILPPTRRVVKTTTTTVKPTTIVVTTTRGTTEVRRDVDKAKEQAKKIVTEKPEANRDDDDITTAKTFSDAPRTEKLIAPTSTTSTTATIPVSTTITPNPTTLKSTTTTKAATIAIPTTILPPTRRVVKTTTTTVKPTTIVVTTTRGTTEVRRDVDKAKEQAKKIVTEKPEGSGAATGVVIMLVFVVLIVAAALVSRSARGRAAIARLRGRASSDPEVRYLTSDHD